MKKWLVNAALLVGSLLLSLLLFEVGLRVAEFSYPSLYVVDETTGHRLRPGVEGCWEEEGVSQVRISSDGLRDREHQREKPANTIRIAVIGDSYAEALQVPMEAAFWKVLERELNRCGAFDKKMVEVINFGVSGYGTAQELLTLQNRVWAWSPDIVVLAFLTGNDVVNNSKALEPDKARPFFVEKDGALALDRSFIRTPAYRMKSSRSWRIIQAASDYSRTIQLLNRLKNRWQQRPAPVDPAADKAPGKEAGLDDAIYRAPESAQWQDAWNVTEGLILMMRDEVRARGARFVVATLSSGIQVHPDADVRGQFMRRLGVPDLFYPDRRISNLCERNGIEVLTLAPELQQYAERNRVFLHGFGNTRLGTGHWNEKGHRLAGEIMAERLCKGTLR